MSITEQKQELEQLLGHRGRWLQPVPAALLGDYRALRQVEFARVISLWGPLLMLAYLACLALTLVLYRSHLRGDDVVVFSIAESMALAAGVIGLLMARQPHWQRNANEWIPYFYGFIIWVKVMAGLLMRSDPLAVNQIYITLLAILMGMLSLNLSLRASLTWCGLGATAFVGAPWMSEWSYAGLFAGYYGLTSAVCLFVATIREDKDRMAFFQAMLLACERQEVQRLNDELAELVMRDGLTGLANRRRFDEALQREWERARRRGLPLSILMIDVDHFKRYNDHYGHPAGDQCLIDVAQAIAGGVHRTPDVVARYGGEEFVVLLPETDEQGARELAQRLIARVDALNLPHEASLTAEHVTISAGLAALVPDGASPVQVLLEQADSALYRAKEAGRHRFSD